jgi:hypothetical protein
LGRALDTLLLGPVVLVAITAFVWLFLSACPPERLPALD